MRNSNSPALAAFGFPARGLRVWDTATLVMTKTRPIPVVPDGIARRSKWQKDRKPVRLNRAVSCLGREVTIPAHHSTLAADLRHRFSRELPKAKHQPQNVEYQQRNQYDADRQMRELRQEHRPQPFAGAHQWVDQDDLLENWKIVEHAPWVVRAPEEHHWRDHHVNVERVGSSASEQFAARKVPSITIHSLTQQTWDQRILHTRKDKISQLRLDDYCQSCKLVAAYLAFLDQLYTPPRPSTAQQ